MMKLKTGYFLTGSITGLILLIAFLWSLPDGTMKITYCDVGQGDAAYVLFPDGRDMLVDGGPNDRVLACLGRVMPFWDRHINIVLLSHPQRDHMQGLISVLARFSVDYVVRSDIDNQTEGYAQFRNLIRTKQIPEKLVHAGDAITVGQATLTLLWPSGDFIAAGKSSVLGTSTVKEINDYSIVFRLTYGSFDALFTGDADSRIQANMPYELLANNSIEVLKFPHHGSKTAVTDAFLSLVSPELTVISVGKNSYGHPAQEVIQRLRDTHSNVERTDESGDIHITTNGRSWHLVP